MQKLVFCVFLALPLLLEGQQTINEGVVAPQFQYYDSCTPDDRRAIDRIEAAIRPYYYLIPGRFRLGKVVIICEEMDGGGAWGGTINIGHVSSLGGRFEYTLRHEFLGHFSRSVSQWDRIEEGLADGAAYTSFALTGGAEWVEKAVAGWLRDAAVMDQQIERSRGWPLNYRQALLPIYTLLAANGAGHASNWMYSDGLARINQAIIAASNAKGGERLSRIEVIQAIASVLPAPVDGQDPELWLRQQAVYGPVPFGIFADASLPSPSIINPNQFELAAFEYPTPAGANLQFLRSLSVWPWQDLPNKIIKVNIKSSEGRSVRSGWTLRTGVWNIPAGLPADAYTLETEDEGVSPHRQQFVIGNQPTGLVILKTDFGGMIREQPISVGNARVIFDGMGYAVVEPNCKDASPCNFIVQSQARLETFTVLTRWWQDRVMRLNNRRPVFDLPDSLSLAPGKSAVVEVRNLVAGIPDYEWSITPITPGVKLDQSSGHGDANVRITLLPGVAPGEKVILRFNVPSSVDTPRYIEVRATNPPPRSRGGN